MLKTQRILFKAVKKSSSQAPLAAVQQLSQIKKKNKRPADAPNQLRTKALRKQSSNMKATKPKLKEAMRKRQHYSTPQPSSSSTTSTLVSAQKSFLDTSAATVESDDMSESSWSSDESGYRVFPHCGSTPTKDADKRSKDVKT